MKILLLSGGIDSAAIAAWKRPDVTLFVDYGQQPAKAEAASARAIARELRLHHDQIAIDLTPIGGGLLHSAESGGSNWPSPEWWPYRNQLLISFAASWAVMNLDVLANKENHELLIGSVLGDGDRHIDGKPAFYEAIDSLLSMQEGGLHVAAPAAQMSTTELIGVSGVGDHVLGWTHSCHRSNVPCSECPGCYKREQVLESTGRLL